jgi:hypothetical protein
MNITRADAGNKNIWSAIFCFLPVLILLLTTIQSGLASEPVVVDNGDFTFTSIWDFNDLTNYTLSNLTASNGELNLTIKEHYWNQSSAQDFSEGQGSNIVGGDGVVISTDYLILGYLQDQSFCRPNTWNYSNGSDSIVESQWSSLEKGWLYSQYPKNITLQVSTIQPDQVAGIDTYIDEANQLTNYGGFSSLRVERGGSDRNSLLWFDVSSLSDTKVLDARLELYMYSSEDASSLDISAHRITNSWAEMSATWQRRDAFINWNTFGGDYNPIALDTITGLTNNFGWKSWNITTSVNDWINGVYNNYGIILRAPSGSNTWKLFYSSDSGLSTLRPRLIVTYYPLNTFYETAYVSQDFSVLDQSAYVDSSVSDFELGNLNNITIIPAGGGEIILGSKGYSKFETMDDVTDWEEDPSTKVSSGSFQLSNTIIYEGTGSMRLDYDLASVKQTYGVRRSIGSPWDWSRYTSLVIWSRSSGQGELMKVILEDSWGATWESSPNPLTGSWYEHSIDLADFTGDISSINSIKLHFFDTTLPTTTYIDNISLIGGSPYYSNGIYTSRVIDGGYPVQWESILWEEDKPAGTNIWLRTRTGNTSTPDASWSGWSSPYTIAGGSAITSPEGQYIQYRAYLSTTNTDFTPSISEVTLIKSDYNYTVDIFENIKWARVFVQLNEEIIWEKIIDSTSSLATITFDIGRYLDNLGDNVIMFGLTVNSNSTNDVNISVFVDDFQIKGLNGFYTSKIYDAGSEAIWGNVIWNGDIPIGANITLRTRSSIDNITWSPFSPPLPYNMAPIPNPIGRYIQYELAFKAQTLGVTPVFKDINITFTKYSYQGYIIFNNDLVVENVTNWGILSSNASLNGQIIRFEYSINSGANWYQVPSDGNLSFVITSTNKIRFKAIFEALDTSLTPTLFSVNLTYSVNRPPIIIGIVPNQSQPEDGGPWSIDLTPYESDYEDSGNYLRWFITGENNSLYALNGEYSADDVFTFTPIPDAFGNNQVTLWLEDNYGARTSQSLWINITPVNDPPDLQGVIPSFDKNENDPNWQLDLSGYKYDKDNSLPDLSWSAFGWDTSLFDSVSIAGDIVTFDLATDAYGNDEITIVLTDAMYADSQNIWVNVTLVNKPPVINGSIPSFDKVEDDPIWTLDLTSYETDREDPYPSLNLVWSLLGVNNSLLSVSISDNNITFTPIPEKYGNNQITIQLTDSYGATDYQKIWVNITPSNDAPRIVGIIPSFEKNEDAMNWSINVSRYKYDVDNLSSQLYWQILGWDTSLFDSVGVVGDIITFDLAPDSNGNNNIYIRLSDGLLNDTQEIWVNITSVNDAPQILSTIPDFDKLEDALPWTLNLTSYESDIEDIYPSSLLTWSAIDVDPNLLSVVVVDNNLTFTLKPDAYGNDEIMILLTDSGGAVDYQYIWVNVTSVNDAPKIVGIIPSFYKNEDTDAWILDLSGYKFDVDNPLSELYWQISGWDTSLFNSVVLVGNIITFDLKSEVSGNDQITITLSDGLLTDTQDIWVNVSSINDPPQIEGTIPDFDKNEDDFSWTLDLTAYETDIEDEFPSPSLTWIVADIDSNLLSITISDNNLTFTLKADAYGNDEIIIILKDSEGATNSQKIWVNVTPDNDAPRIIGMIPSFNKKEDASEWDIDLSPYKYDVDNLPSELNWAVTGWDPTLFDSVSLAGNILLFELASDAYGNDLITITLSDGFLSDTQDIWVNVTSVNDAPVILNSIPNIQKQEDSPSWTLDLTTYESDIEDGSPSAALTWSVSGLNPLLISLTISDNNLTFTLIPDAYGNNYITIILTDSDGKTDSQGVWVEITPINDPPTIQSTLPNIVTSEDTPVSISLLSYGSDVEETPGQLRWSLLNTNGSIYSWYIDPATNTLYINPLPNAYGTDDVSLTLMDSGGAIVSKPLQILVLSVNDAPYIHPAIPQSLFRILEEQPISLILTGFENDVEDSNDILTWEVTGVDISIIQVSLNSETDELVIVPVVVFPQGETESIETEITLVLRDSDGATSQQNVTVTIIPVNNAPVIDDLPDLIIRFDETYKFDFSPYVFDEDTPNNQLVVTTSEDTTDKGNGFIDVKGLNLTLNYPESKNGSTISVLITVSDGQLSSYAIMLVSVTNQPPPKLIDPIQDVNFYEDEKIDNAFDLDDHFRGYENGVLSETAYLAYSHHGNNYIFVIINKDNKVNFTAAQDWFGEEQITFRARDIYGAITECTITVTVNPINDPPVIYGVENQVCKVNESRTLNLGPYISDVDTPKEALMIADNSDYTTAQGHNLIFYYDTTTMEFIEIMVYDGEDHDSITIQVNAMPNSPPSISSVPEIMVRGGEVYLFSLLPYVSDRDNDIQDLQIWTDSDYITINLQDNMLLQIDFPSEMIGYDETVTVSISDGLDSNSTQLTIHITNELIPKLLNNLPNLFFAEDTIFIHAINLNDYFQNIIEYQYFGNKHVNITIENGWVTLSAAENWSGYETITFRGILGDAFVEDTIEVVVKPINDPPIISPFPSIKINVSEIWGLNLLNYIQDIDTPVPELDINFDSPHVIFYGMNIYFQYPFEIYEEITVTVSDGQNSVQGIINVTVTSENNAPIYLGLQREYHFKPGEDWTIDLDEYFYDVDEDDLTFTSNREEVFIDPITHTATWTPKEGENKLEGVVFSVNDGSVTIDSSPIDLVVDIKETTPSFWEQYWWLPLILAFFTSILIAFHLIMRREEEEEIQYAIPVDKAVEYLAAEGGGNYLIKSETSDSAYKIFSGLLQYDFEGLCITTKQPEDLTKQYELGKAWIIKLSLRGQKKADGEGEETKMMGLLALGDEEREGDKYIFSSNFKCIVETIEEFITGGDHKVVLLDGLEYILGGEELIMYIGFIASLRERLKDRNSCLLIPVDPKTLSEKELGLLERETVHLGKALQDYTKEKREGLGILGHKEPEEVDEVADIKDLPPPPPNF